MLKKKLILAVLAAFFTVFLTDWIIHGMLLKGIYHETAYLWRTESEMQQHMHFMLGGQLIVAALFTIIFTKGYEKKGWTEGARYGAYMAALSTGQMLICHAVSPYPLRLTLAWIVTCFVQFMVVGSVVAVVYSRK